MTMTNILLSLALACSKQDSSTATYSNPQRPTAPGEITRLADDEAVVATWSGGSMKYDGFVKENINQLKQLEAEYLTNRYNFERSAIREKIVTQALEDEARKNGHVDSDGKGDIEALVDANVKQPGDEEIKAFFENAAAQDPRLKGADLETFKPQIISYLTEEPRGQYISSVIDKLDIEINLPFPNVPRIDVSEDDDPVLGDKNAPVTIIQFAEYQCPYCGRAGEVVDQILSEYEGKVKMVFRDFPLDFHDRAIPAAVAANCAGEQGKYWEMHKKLMADQTALDEETLKSHATAIELDIASWETCLADPKQAEEVVKDQADGASVGVSGTPAFFVNGIFFSGALPYDQFKDVIDRELNLLQAE